GWRGRFQPAAARLPAGTAAALASAARAPSSLVVLAGAARCAAANGLSRCIFCASARLHTLSPCGRGSTARSAGGVRGMLPQGMENRSQHSFQIRQYVVVPEPQHQEIVGGEPSVTAMIG